MPIKPGLRRTGLELYQGLKNSTKASMREPAVSMEIETTFSPSEPIKQGELIARANFETCHPFDQIAVVVTADCDLERVRPDHHVTLLRVVPVSDFVQHVWCR